MPWKESTRLSEREEFVAMARQQAIPMSELCRRFGISRKTGYKWLSREDSHDRSRRPLNSPTRTAADLEQRVVELRQRHPAWGGRKISRWLLDRGIETAPSPSTVTHILRRHDLLSPAVAGAGGRYTRFEHPRPNALWQMDFKGDVATAAQRCHPLTAVDDHSRYAVVLQALPGQARDGVQQALTRTFRTYGLPERMNMDNGQPWGSPSALHGVSRLTVWLIRLGVGISFSAPAHPQTNGKDERFHRSLKAEVLAGRYFENLSTIQHAFDRWRRLYNHERPHDALGLNVPATRYRPSPRPFPEALPAIEYSADDHVQMVGWNGEVRFRGRRWKVSNALQGLPIAFRRGNAKTEQFDLYFCHHRLGTIDLADV